MKFETKIFEEPHLEFGDKHHHPDPRLGLFEAGPLQIPPGDVKVAHRLEDQPALFCSKATPRGHCNARHRHTLVKRHSVCVKGMNKRTSLE